MSALVPARQTPDRDTSIDVFHTPLWNDAILPAECDYQFETIFDSADFNSALYKPQDDLEEVSPQSANNIEEMQDDMNSDALCFQPEGQASYGEDETLDVTSSATTYNSLPSQQECPVPQPAIVQSQAQQVRRNHPARKQEKSGKSVSFVAPS